ncbi:MAG: rhodanese-like domain-containing protein [Proteobacteria bacterium]|nr:rhodanese-like domain-containing protein [Pseudomonadota bacterium]NDF00757.1 rhodanese-like domain-containing protein [Verrucomicrobiota bacterium]
MKAARILTSLLLAGTLLLTGCQMYDEYGLTHKLWADPSLTDRYTPAGAPNLKSFQRPTSTRTLVAYDEHRERDSSDRRRAFYLPDSAKALAAHRKPGFASSTPGPDWVEIPVITADQAAPDATLYLRLAADNQTFTIFRNGVPDGPYQLPTYVDQSSTAFRVVMTPVAVVAGVPPEQPIVCYCAAGFRSSIMARRLAQAGHREVFNLEGAIFDWACEGRPLVNEHGATQAVHPFNWMGRLMLQRQHCAAVPALRH